MTCGCLGLGTIRDFVSSRFAVSSHVETGRLKLEVNGLCATMVRQIVIV